MEEEIKKDEPAEGEIQKPLEEMTVKELREQVKEIPGVSGVHAMKKEELLDAVNEAKDVKDEKPAEEAKDVKDKKPAKEAKKKAVEKQVRVRALKGKIITLKGEKEAAQKEKDRKKIHILRRRINRIKKQTRKVAQA